jgi:hypothetical protein
MGKSRTLMRRIGLHLIDDQVNGGAKGARPRVRPSLWSGQRTAKIGTSRLLPKIFDLSEQVLINDPGQQPLPKPQAV